jgi:Uncharacterized conserved protein (DUF2267)
MSATGLDVFDNTVQTTQNRGPPGTRSASRLAYSRRRAASLRDRLPLDEAAHLGAQLPLLVPYDEWYPASGIRKDRHQKEFLAHVAEEMDGARPVHINEALRTVFKVLGRSDSARQTTVASLHTLEAASMSLKRDCATEWPLSGTGLIQWVHGPNRGPSCHVGSKVAKIVPQPRIIGECWLS